MSNNKYNDLLLILRLKREKELKKEFENKIIKIDNNTENNKINPHNDIEKIRLLDAIEAFIEKASLTKYKYLFELKGGISIYTLLGKIFSLTSDLDINFYNQIDENEIKPMIEEIINTKSSNDYIKFEYIDSQPNRKTSSKYKCFLIKLKVIYYGMKLNKIFEIDLSCCDAIINKSNNIKFQSLFSNNTLDINVSPLEIHLAEKVNAMFASTKQLNYWRIKDYYYFYFIYFNFNNKINYQKFYLSIIVVFKQRGTKIDFELFYKKINTMLNDETFNELSNNFFNNRNDINLIEINKLVDLLKTFIQNLENNKTFFSEVVYEKIVESPKDEKENAQESESETTLIIEDRNNNRGDGGMGGIGYW